MINERADQGMRRSANVVPVVGRPPPNDGSERGKDRRRIGSAQCADLGAEPFPDSLDRRHRWFDQQRRAVAADAESQEIEPCGQVHDSGFVLVEDQTPGCQPFGQACLDLFGLPPGVAERDQIISLCLSLIHI